MTETRVLLPDFEPVEGGILKVCGKDYRVTKVERTAHGWTASLKPADIDNISAIYWPTNDYIPVEPPPPIFPKPSLCDQIHIRPDEFMHQPLPAANYGRLPA